MIGFLAELAALAVLLGFLWWIVTLLRGDLE